jgi:hypothetical protein
VAGEGKRVSAGGVGTGGPMPLEGGGDRGGREFVRGGRIHAGKQGGEEGWVGCEQGEGGRRRRVQLPQRSGGTQRWDRRVESIAAVRINS